MHFDWTTLGLQTLNLLVLVWLLRRFLFQPVKEVIAARRAAADGLLADAAAAREAATAEAQRAAEQQKSLTADTDRIRAEARDAAAAERATLLRQAADEAAATRATVEMGLAEERSRMQRTLQGDAKTLAVKIATRLIGRVPSVGALDTWLSTQPPDALTGMTGDTIEVVTATELSASDQSACSALLRQRFGAGARFSTDPNLIAGLELRGPHATLRNNWRADLDRIAEELARDDVA